MDSCPRSPNPAGEDGSGASTPQFEPADSPDGGESKVKVPNARARSRRPPTALSKAPAPATQLSRSAFFADFYAYPAAFVALVAFAFASNPHGWFSSLCALIIGLASWSLVEYMLHRYVLHHVIWVKRQHDVHHHDQMALVGTPTWFSMLVFIAFVTAPATLMTNIEVAACFTAGMMLGYLWYVTAHYGMHHWRIRPAGYLGRLRRRHALHHHFDDLGNFGVTSSFWDHIFRTNIKS
jgi:sterol desaturase/sphingolipid hydroxylase (fatty acid hydroxylase superfamily)